MRQRRNRLSLLLAALLGSVCFSARGRAADDGAADKPVVVDTSRSAKAQLRPVPLDAVRWTKGFWAERYDQSRDVTLRKLWDLAADPEAGHVLDNMRIAGGLKKGEFAGTNWQDAWLYKWIESAAAYYAIIRDPWIAARMDEAIELIAAAQEDDGYIATQITARNKPRFTDPREHEVYSMGHLLTAACVHHRVTGKDSLLKAATRCGDFLCETLGVTVAPCYAHNPSAVMGLVELYRETGPRKYLDCAKPFAIRVRIPGWATGATVAVNGAASANAPVVGQYLFMQRPWQSGDVIELNLPMPVRLMQAHPKAEQLRNQVAVMRGPLLYCLESKDLPQDLDLNNVYIPDDLQPDVHAADDLPFGIVALTGKVLYREEPSWTGDLYRKVERHSLKPLPIRMIPCFAWANRGPAAMSVWLPVVWSK